MSLLDEFALLGHDDEGRKIIDGTRLDYGLGGALLLELALSGRIDVVGKKVVVIDPAPTGDALVDDALARIRNDSHDRKPGHWLGKFAKGTRESVLSHLVATEVLRVERGTVLAVFPRTRYPAADGTEPALEADARRRMRAAILDGSAVDPRTAALCSLVAATEMDRKIFADLDRRLVKTRLKEISEGSWAAVAVRKALQEIQSAIIAGAVAASTAAVISS